MEEGTRGGAAGRLDSPRRCRRGWRPRRAAATSRWLGGGRACAGGEARASRAAAASARNGILGTAALAAGSRPAVAAGAIRAARCAAGESGELRSVRIQAWLALTESGYDRIRIGQDQDLTGSAGPARSSGEPDLPNGSVDMRFRSAGRGAR